MTNKIEDCIKKFTGDYKKQPDGRYASFDYCFNYFQSFRDKQEDLINEENLQTSCLQLGFYLASWGMYRGSSFLLQHSCLLLKGPLEVIANFEENDRKIWEIDVNTYSKDKNIELILGCAEKIRMSLKDIECRGCKTIDHKMSDTLVTKIMLGVFGNVPAYDTYFLLAMKKLIGGTLNRESMERIEKFYKENEAVIDGLSDKIQTVRFPNSDLPKRNYTKAKIIDMYGFMKGLEIDEKNKENKRKKMSKN